MANLGIATVQNMSQPVETLSKGCGRPWLWLVRRPLRPSSSSLASPRPPWVPPEGLMLLAGSDRNRFSGAR